MLARDIVWHVRRCQATGWAIPEGKEKCRKCRGLVKFRHSHESKCRGSALLNRTCSKCGKVFPEPPEGMLSRPLGNHEKRCNGQRPVAEQDAGNEAANGANRGRGRGRGVGRARLVAKAKAKAKPKASPKGAAKARAKVGTRAKAKAKSGVRLVSRMAMRRPATR